jgi:predicted RNA-binding protein YlqC (UPF0109 family)
MSYTPIQFDPDEYTLMEYLVTVIVTSLVSNEDGVSVREIPGEHTSILEIQVDKEDLGKVIGKHGKTATSLRVIIYTASFKTGKRYTVDINSNEEEYYEEKR